MSSSTRFLVNPSLKIEKLHNHKTRFGYQAQYNIIKEDLYSRVPLQSYVVTHIERMKK
jgi:hypothetical protein